MPGKGHRYQPNYIAVKECYYNQVRLCKIFSGADVDSDHKLVLMSTKLKFRKRRIRKSTRNLNKVKANNEAIKQFRKGIHEKTDSYKNLGNTVQEKWDVINEREDRCFGKQEMLAYKPWIT